MERGEALPWDFLCKIFLTALTPCLRVQGAVKSCPASLWGLPSAAWLATLLGLPAEFAAAVGLVSIFCGATNALIPPSCWAFELFSGAGLELIALGCGVCYMLSGYHGLSSSHTFRHQQAAVRIYVPQTAGI